MCTIANGVVFVLSAALLATSSMAQETAAEVTDAQIALLKTGMHTGCQKRGIERGHDPAKVNAFCDCMSRTLETTVTREDWQQLYWLEWHGEHAQEEALLAKWLPGVKACTTL